MAELTSIKFKNKVDEYKQLFGLQNWTIIIQPVGTIAETSVDYGVPEADAMTRADPRYNRAVMSVRKEIFEKESSWEEIIIHELIHVIMALYDYFSDNLGQEGANDLFFIAREKSVSELTAIMMRLIKK